MISFTLKATLSVSDVLSILSTACDLWVNGPTKVMREGEDRRRREPPGPTWGLPGKGRRASIHL